MFFCQLFNHQKISVFLPHLAKPETLKVVSPINIAANENTISVTFTIMNVGLKPTTIRSLFAIAKREGDIESNMRNDFPVVNNIHLRPGEKYIYNQERFFTQAGDYSVEPMFRFGNSSEMTILCVNPGKFNIKYK